MKLILDIVKNGKNAPQVRSFHFENKDIVIGRNDECDWVLEDQNSYISGEHARILYKQGTYFIKDESTNGTFLKNPYKRLPKGNPVKIKSSDVFVIGDHELQARFSNNDYTQDDIVDSSSIIEESSENIIPEDDFLFDAKSDQPSININNIEGTNELDVANILNHTEISNNNELSDFSVIGVNDFGIKEKALEEHVSVPNYTEVESEKKEKPMTPEAIEGLAISVSILEQKLGIEINSLEQNKRDMLMQEIGDIITNTLDSMKMSLQLKDETTQNLHLTSVRIETDNNPIKLGAAASQLLQQSSKNNAPGMMKLSEALKRSFSEIDTHCIALHGATKNVLNIAVSKFSPKNLEYRFESIGALRGVLPKQQLMWKAYVGMFNSLNDKPEEGVEMIKEDFTKEYEKIAYSLKLYSKKNRI